MKLAKDVKGHEIGYSETPPNNLIDPVDMHAEVKAKNTTIAKGKVTAALLPNGANVPVDTNWLSSAARAYNISPSITDYIVVPVILFYTDIPNKNGFGFSLENLASWNPEQGMSFYQTWKGKPVFFNHDNKDVRKSSGIVLDVFLRRQFAKDKAMDGPQGDYWKELALLAVDRDKNRELASGIMSRDISAYSMGTIVMGGYICSVCERKVGTCRHLDMRKHRYGMKLVDTGKDIPELAYVIGLNPVGFEVSAVTVPAYEMAENDKVQLFS